MVAMERPSLVFVLICALVVYTKCLPTVALSKEGNVQESIGASIREMERGLVTPLVTPLATPLVDPLVIPLKHYEIMNDHIEDEEEHRRLSRHQRALDNTLDDEFRRALTSPIKDTVEGTTQITPLFQGIGTHYADVWVGEGPEGPQRQTVIVDTGSHYTAFPCTGCKNCGESYHTNKYFDSAKSTTFKKLPCNACDAGGHCNKDRCEFSQSYSEGSSWHAYQATDKFWVGRDLHDEVNKDFAARYALDDFMFGCQFSETGLFRTQLANGIMGMSASAATFVNKLYKADKVEYNRFTMCFQRHDYYEKEHGIGSGAMIFGGVDTRFHTSQMLFVANEKDSGWFTVHVTGMYLRKGGGEGVVGDKDQKVQKIAFNEGSINSGKGVIVDSGTTDTYLHSSLSNPFKNAFMALAGRAYSNSHFTMTEEEILNLPTVIIQLRSKSTLNSDDAEGLVKNSGSEFEGSGDDILIAMPPSHYMEYNAKTKKYTPRLYFTEGSGGVLGANFMQGHDVLFDWQEHVIGFARSDCDYASIPTDSIGENPNSDCEFLLDGDFVQEKCSAVTSCDSNAQTPLEIATGTELWGRVVKKQPKGSGKACIDVAKEQAGPGVTFSNCNDSECFEARPCSCACEKNGTEDSAGLAVCSEKKTPSPTIDDTPSDLCEDLWGSCHVSDQGPCQQVKIESVYNAKDENCYQIGNSTRGCSKGACSSSTPRVPYRDQVIIGISKSTWEATNSTDSVEQFFEDSMASALAGTDVVAGDIQLVMVEEWKNVDNLDGNILGTKVIVEVGIPNTQYNAGESWKEVCEGQVSKTAETAEDVKVKLTDVSFTDALLSELKKGGGDVFKEVDEVKVIEAWTQRMEHCDVGGSGGGGSNSGGDTGGGGYQPIDDISEGGGSGTIVFSFFITFAAVGAFLWHRKKSMDSGGKYARQINEDDEDGVEMA